MVIEQYNNLKSWGHHEPLAPFELCACPGTREQRSCARCFQSIPWHPTTGSQASPWCLLFGKVSEDMERFYTCQWSVFLLCPSNFFHPLFSHNKDILRKRKGNISILSLRNMWQKQRLGFPLHFKWRFSPLPESLQSARDRCSDQNE